MVNARCWCKHSWSSSVLLHFASLVSLECWLFVMPRGEITRRYCSYAASSTRSDEGSQLSSAESQYPVFPKGKGKGKSKYDDMRWNNNGKSIQLRQCFSSAITCSFCKEPGHHTSNCVKALEARVKHVAVDCARGRHQPYLHGCWRCDWCGIHIHERDVMRNNFEQWQKSTLMQEELNDRWMLDDAERQRLLRR